MVQLVEHVVLPLSLLLHLAFLILTPFVFENYNGPRKALYAAAQGGPCSFASFMWKAGPESLVLYSGKLAPRSPRCM